MGIAASTFNVSTVVDNTVIKTVPGKQLLRTHATTASNSTRELPPPPLTHTLVSSLYLQNIIAGPYTTDLKKYLHKYDCRVL